MRLLNVCQDPDATIEDKRVRSNRATKVFKEFEENHKYIELLTPEDDERNEEKHRIAVEDKYIDIKALVEGGVEQVQLSTYPTILHKDHHLNVIVVRHHHLKYMHAGKRLLYYLLNLKYWIPAATYVIRKCVYKCSKFMSQRAEPLQQMGNIPYSLYLLMGVSTSLDQFIRTWKGNGPKIYKSWIAVFICLVTKAIHTEVVTELTTVG